VKESELAGETARATERGCVFNGGADVSVCLARLMADFSQLPGVRASDQRRAR